MLWELRGMSSEKAGPGWTFCPTVTVSGGTPLTPGWLSCCWTEVAIQVRHECLLQQLRAAGHEGVREARVGLVGLDLRRVGVDEGEAAGRRVRRLAALRAPHPGEHGQHDDRQAHVPPAQARLGHIERIHGIPLPPGTPTAGSSPVSSTSCEQRNCDGLRARGLHKPPPNRAPARPNREAGRGVGCWPWTPTRWDRRRAQRRPSSRHRRSRTPWPGMASPAPARSATGPRLPCERGAPGRRAGPRRPRRCRRPSPPST